MISLNVSPNLIIKYNRVSYTRQDLAQAVSYWRHQISLIEDPAPIGIAYSGLSFSCIALLLALYRSGRDYHHLGNLGNQLNGNTFRELNLSTIFVAGDTRDDQHFVNIPKYYIRTDSWEHAWASGRWPMCDDLVINFTQEQTVSAYTSGTTDRPKLESLSAYVEAISIQRAQEYFFESTDYCVFLHGMSHQGVHTTAILPAVFSATTLSIAGTNTWAEESVQATHIQYFYTMKDLFPLPQRHFRMITTGGDVFKSTLLDYIQQSCSYDHLYDTYGLTECLPPLAIKDIHTAEDLAKPFDWVNVAYHCHTNNQDSIVITRPDGIVYTTSDRGSYTNNQLQFFGRRYNLIRYNGNLISVRDFKQAFENSTGIVNYAIEIVGGDFMLHALTQDKDAVTNFIQDNYCDINLLFVDSLRNNGGIKIIS